MATPLTVDEQCCVLCQTIENSEVVSDALRTTTIHFCENYLHLASSDIRSLVAETIEKKFGINVNEVLGLAKTQNVAEPVIAPEFPTQGWIGDYLRYTDRHEAPDLFHFWVGVSVLHAAIRRSVYFEHGYYHIFPNCYIILVAPPGVCKKSTATNIGVEILQEVSDVTIVREKITPEALISTLSKKVVIAAKAGVNITPTATAFIHAPELAVFLGRETYNEGLIALLTSLYDCHTKWEYTTKVSGKLALHNLHLTLLGATTPDLITRTLPESAIGGGFMSRALFIARENSPRCEPFPAIRDPLLRERLVSTLIDIAQREGQCVQSPDALAWCEEWYKQQRTHICDDMALTGYYERKQSHLIKLAMTLLVSEGSELVITPDTYIRALKILDLTERTMPTAFEQMSKTRAGQGNELVLHFLARHGGRLDHSTLLRKVYGRMDAKQFQGVIATLYEAGFIDVVSTPKREYVLRRLQ